MLKILCITDNKPGHRSQIDGLLQALSHSAPVQSCWQSINEPDGTMGFTPDLIIAAGHRTHWPALKYKWKRGGKLIVLMKPSLPLWLFDLCIAPRHDGLNNSHRVLNTEGALNAVPASLDASYREGLILIGGPSKHYQWDNEQLIHQLQQLIKNTPGVQWTLTTSRRTPESFEDYHHRLEEHGIKIVPFEQTDREWLLEHYRRSGLIWTTEDSVSMVYESLSTGAVCGVLRVPQSKPNRISKNLMRLIEEGKLIDLSNVSHEPDTSTTLAQLKPSSPPLQESQRAAQYILRHLLSQTAEQAS